MKIARSLGQQALNTYYFELCAIAVFLIYVVLCLTPSSYGMVLALFGEEGKGLFWGNPRPIRSDEWAVWTPYFQSVVNNNFERINGLSLYHEDFRSFNALPIKDWGMFFKPLLWPFLIFEPARAYSLHHALIMLSFVIGWKVLLESIFPHHKSRFVFGLFSLLIFFSGFVQTWWTTIGPILAVTPWLLIALLWCKNISLIKATIFCYVSIVWILSHTYPPIIISSAYLAALLVFCFHRELINIKSIIYIAVASIIALAICFIYLQDAIQAMINTVYPGQRISRGGELLWQIWISSFIPYLTHSNYQPLINANICEVSVVTSLLPMMALAFLDYSTIKNTSKTVWIAFGLSMIVMSVWMLAPMPDLIAKILLLDRVPGARLLWIFGLTLQIFVLYLLLSMSIKITTFRLIVFTALLSAGYVLPTLIFGISIGDKSAWELLAVPALIGATFIIRNKSDSETKLTVLLLISLGINLIYFGAFNPGQSAKPIFSLKHSPAVQQLKLQQEEDSRGWLIVAGYPGAILQGLGLNSVTHVLVAPKLDFFRKFFPDLDSDSFNNIFNRYAHIHLTDEAQPYSPQADVVRVPRSTFGGLKVDTQEAVLLLREPSSMFMSGGYIDNVEISEHEIVLTGWGLTTSREPLFLLDDTDRITAEVERVSRPDVVSAIGDPGLIHSGFKLKIRSKSRTAHNVIADLCLYTSDGQYGLRQLQPGNSKMLYQCGVEN
jgi:hypothetical protein